jgi:hypothetical protein
MYEKIAKMDLNEGGDGNGMLLHLPQDHVL